MKKIKLPQDIWYDAREVELSIPDDWQETVYNIPGHDKPPMTRDKIKTAIASPIGMPPLRELAKGKNDVAILFDDMTRSTRAYEIVPFVLEELSAAGISDDKIRFIAAVANHHALDRFSMVKKLGEDIVARFPVFNHCPFTNLTDVGTTSYGTRALVNSEVVRCDLKISIGSVVPHPFYGFGGGAKMIAPGVTAFDTVKAHHEETHMAWRDEQRKKNMPVSGRLDDNPLNADAQEIARMVGLDMTINCLVNKWGETTDIFAGTLEAAYPLAVEAARDHYLAVNTRDNDIVISNNFVKASEAMLAMSSIAAVNPEGGDLVILASSPSGQVIHYLMDLFGKPIVGDGQGPGLPPHLNSFIIYNVYPEAKMLERHINQAKFLMTSDWNMVIDRLNKSHAAGAKVAVYPNADIQYFPHQLQVEKEYSGGKMAVAYN